MFFGIVLDGFEPWVDLAATAVGCTMMVKNNVNTFCSASPLAFSLDPTRPNFFTLRSRILYQRLRGSNVPGLFSNRPARWQDRLPMPLEAVTQLSDDECAAVPKAKAEPKSKPSPKPKVKMTPKPKGSPKDTPKAKEAKAKVKESPKAKVLKRPSASNVDEKETEADKAAGVVEAATEPSSSQKKQKVQKKPAGAYHTVKYLYHAEGKWGIKVNGKEYATVGSD